MWLCLLTSTASAAEPDNWARFAIVIGYNASDDTALAPLRYADDDAVKHAQLLGLTTERTELLTDLDADSQRAFDGVRYVAPTRANVLRALASMRTDMAKARARGASPVLFFVYSGHGNYDQEGRGYVHLRDGRFTTRDLYYEVLGPTESPEPYHVVLVIDACNAALLVNSRGGPVRRRAAETSLKLESYPRVGVILSSSGAFEVHEWGRLLSGIFSHEVRSALMGAGDLDDDGEVSFPELSAFVAAANSKIKNETFRIRPYIRPPLSAPNMPILSFATARFPARVRVDSRLAGRAHLLSTELLRFADFHRAADTGFWLGLPSTEGFTIVAGDREYVIPQGARGDLTVASLSVRPRSTMAGRSTDQYFEERLFAEPLSRESGSSWLEGEYETSLLVERNDRVPWYDNGGAWALSAGGVGLLGAAIGLHLTGRLDIDDYESCRSCFTSAEAKTHLDQADKMLNGAYAAYSIGGAALLGGILWFVLDERFENSTYRPPLQLDISPTSIQLHGTF